MRAEIEEACLALREHPPLNAPTREVLVAYARLAAFASHWPNRASADVTELLELHLKVREMEPDRFIKQRRLQLAHLAELARHE